MLSRVPRRRRGRPGPHATVVAPDALLRVAAGVRGLAARLTGHRRARTEIPVVDEFPGGVRMFRPGTGSPLAPLLEVTRRADPSTPERGSRACGPGGPDAASAAR
ncbi:hypothetical protein [Streptomyces sp. NPDC007984]|uniref:hypothetical protein n=1 Tax=Streptomyces sp. NPDC007984 TaxID=3364801 RepID=UPI0036E50BCA